MALKEQMRLLIEEGDGLLDIRALWASIIGPQRLAMASQRRLIRLGSEFSSEIARNIGQANSYVFVGVALPQSAAISPLPVVFDKSDQTGANSGLPALLTKQVGMSWSFMQLLLPGEQIYGQITDMSIASQDVIVSEVHF